MTKKNTINSTLYLNLCDVNGLLIYDPVEADKIIMNIIKSYNILWAVFHKHVHTDLFSGKKEIMQFLEIVVIDANISWIRDAIKMCYNQDKILVKTEGKEDETL